MNKRIAKMPQKRMSDEEIEETIAYVEASWGFEGFASTEDDKKTGRRILRGEITGDEAVAETLTKHGFVKRCGKWEKING